MASIGCAPGHIPAPVCGRRTVAVTAKTAVTKSRARRNHRTPYKYLRLVRPVPNLALVAIVGALVAGCAGFGAVPDDIVTGSVTAKPASLQSEPVPQGVAPGDWAIARLALGEALGARTDTPSVPWENFASATRGTVTPIGEVTEREGASCQEFLISFVRDSAENWLQGEACRRGRSGAWKVDQARLLQRT
jgi:surface antigen